MGNVVVPLLTVATGGVLVWAGITDPDGGVFAGLKRLMDGQASVKRTASTVPSALTYDLALVSSDTTAGAVNGIAHAGAPVAQAAPAGSVYGLPSVPTSTIKLGKKGKKRRGKVAGGKAPKVPGKTGGGIAQDGSVIAPGEKWLNPDYYNADGTRKGKASASSSTAGGKRGKVIAESRTWLGVPYRWAGASRSGVDCSGFTQQVFRTVGISLPHYSAAQGAMGKPVSRAAAQPGDLVFFGTPVHHVGIYLGGGKMRHAPKPGAVVRDETIWGGERVFFRNLLGGK